MKKITGFLSTLVLIAVVFIIAAFVTQAGLLDGILGGSRPPSVDITTVLNQIQLVSELTTTRYETSGSIVIERDMPPLIRALYGDRLVLFGAGTVTAGINLADITADRVTTTTEGGMTLNLPYPQLLDCILHENQTRVLAREVSLFTWEDRTFETSARRMLTLAFRNTALENGIYEQAKEQAGTVIEAFVGAVQPDTPLTITFDDPPVQSFIPNSCKDANALEPTPTPTLAP